MNVVAFTHLNKATNSYQQTIHEKPTHPPLIQKENTFKMTKIIVNKKLNRETK